MRSRCKRKIDRNGLRGEIASIILVVGLVLVACDVVPWRDFFSKDTYSTEGEYPPKTGMSVEWMLRQSFASRIIVSESAKLLYCPISNAASSNWKHLIRKFEGIHDYTNLARSNSPEFSGLKYLTDYSEERVKEFLGDPNMFKFVFVKDPTVRAADTYINKIENSMDRDEYRGFMQNLYNSTYANKELSKKPHPTFRQFVIQVAKQMPEHMDEHWRPQTRLCGFGALKYDFIGRMETLENDAAHVLNRLGRMTEKFPVQEQNTFINNTNTIGPDLQNMLQHIYKEDYAHGMSGEQGLYE